MFQKDYMAEVLEYIEQHINESFNINNIPVSQYLSTMQLYRDFYNITGHSVKEYIRKRRLSNALAMVKHSYKSLADISYIFGYSSQQAFCKCVKAATGLTPMEYKVKDGNYYYPRFCFDGKHQVFVSTETIPEAIHMKFYHSRLRGIENRCVNYLLTFLPNYRGRIFGRNGKQLNNKFCYELMIEYHNEIWDALKLSDFNDIKMFSSQTDIYAKTMVKNMEIAINSAWDYLYLEWLKASMFEQSEKPYFEEYLHKGDKVKKLILYLPVKKRSDYNKIGLKECEDMYFLISRSYGSDGEEKASRVVMDYITSHQLFDTHKIDKYYISNDNGLYSCGVMLNKEIKIHSNSKVELLHIERGKYAILEGSCCGDSTVYEKILSAWCFDNGLRKDKSPYFTVYETNGSFEPEKIKTMVYIKLVGV